MLGKIRSRITTSQPHNRYIYNSLEPPRSAEAAYKTRRRVSPPLFNLEVVRHLSDHAISARPVRDSAVPENSGLFRESQENSGKREAVALHARPSRESTVF